MALIVNAFVQEKYTIEVATFLQRISGKWKMDFVHRRELSERTVQQLKNTVQNYLGDSV